MLVVVAGLPSWLRSIRLRGIGNLNDGWLRVVGFLSVCLAPGVWMSTICGRYIARAVWSPYSGVWVVMRVSRSVYSVVVVGCLMSQWSMTVFRGGVVVPQFFAEMCKGRIV